MRQVTHTFITQTPGAGLHEMTSPIRAWCLDQDVEEGLLTLFIRHTSASLTIQENADPDVLQDLDDFFRQLVPEDGTYRHSAEGPDDMPAHIRSALTATQLSIPIVDGRLSLGAWQGIYVFEHRSQPHRREITAHLLADL